MIAVDVAVVLSGMFARCVHLAVVLSYCGQCQLLKYYIEGLAEKLEEKSIELKRAMKVGRFAIESFISFRFLRKWFSVLSW